MGYSIQDVKACVDDLVTHLGIHYPHRLQTKYELGLHPNILSYEKVETANQTLPAIQKYLIGVSSFFNHPCRFYNIFSVCRQVSLIQPLSKAITALVSAKTPGHEEKLDRLVKATTYDEFESLLFEIVTAARYLAADSVTYVEFFPETPEHRTPDLLIRIDDVLDTYCECKKLSRMSNHAVQLRNDVRDKLNPVISEFRKKNVSVLAEMTFLDDPSSISASRIASACWSSVKAGVPIIEDGFTISVKRLPPYTSQTYKLYPSPDYYWGRYQFRERDEWFGIVHQIYCNYAEEIGAIEGHKNGTSTWLDDVAWDAAIKWKIDNDELLAKKRRFAFSTIFSGLDQIQKKGFESALHVWIESEYCIGNRRDSMLDLYARLQKNSRDFFGWLILNELYFDVSPKGNFDLIEHAHMIGGPMALSKHPPVSAIFTEQVNADDEMGEFGVGVQLPDVDEPDEK